MSVTEADYLLPLGTPAVGQSCIDLRAFRAHSRNVDDARLRSERQLQRCLSKSVHSGSASIGAARLGLASLRLALGLGPDQMISLQAVTASSSSTYCQDILRPSVHWNISTPMTKGPREIVLDIAWRRVARLSNRVLIVSVSEHFSMTFGSCSALRQRHAEEDVLQLDSCKRRLRSHASRAARPRLACVSRLALPRWPPCRSARVVEVSTNTCGSRRYSATGRPDQRRLARISNRRRWCRGQ